MSLLKEARKIFEKEGTLVEPEINGKLIFVGDTHGDLEATQTVIEDYLKDNIVVFLGDYVDRGRNSRETINLLLNKKIKNPEKLILLQGNHEGRSYQRFSPANFWRGLSGKERREYEKTLGKMPLIFSCQKIIGLHGSLPQVNSLKEIKRIKYGSEEWKNIVWGDFTENERQKPNFGRPQIGRKQFQQIMAQLDKELLVRSHQPTAPLYMFNRRCITVFTSSAYAEERRVVVLNLEKDDYEVKVREI